MTANAFERLVPEHIRQFEAYTPSKPDDVLMKLYRCRRLHRLNNNENPLGPPPAARKALETFPPSMAALYPSGDVYHLRYRLAEKFGLHPDQILVGNGSNEVIAFVIKAFCQQGDNIVTADKTFAVYEWVAEFSGFEARLVPLKDFGFDDQGMLEAVDDRTKVVFLCNPNNPTGQYWDENRLRHFLDRIAGRQIMVIDEAYFEFVDQQDYPNGLSLLAEYPNLVVFRTFSKMYALAGLRIGYLAGSQDVVDIIRRTCVVYSVNAPAQAAALGCLQDREHILRTREMVDSGKAFLTQELDGMGLETVVGEGNYIMVKLPISDSLAYRKLMARGIMVRSMTGFRMPNWIRVTVHRAEVLEAFVESLYKVLHG
jgi:histidinol-phosphate aminotransferase